jgi:hypothetical protein
MNVEVEFPGLVSPLVFVTERRQGVRHLRLVLAAQTPEQPRIFLHRLRTDPRPHVDEQRDVEA